MTHLDLFSGIGGFALAAQWTGWTTIAFSEIDPYACKILKQDWPDVPNLGDIRNVRGIKADLVTGGFPCQPFSVAGKRRGSSDDRALWPEMLRVIADTQPTWILAENVPGIISLELDDVLSDLGSIGYASEPIVIPACAMGPDQYRGRVWIVGAPIHSNTNGNGLQRCFKQSEKVSVTWSRIEFERLVQISLQRGVPSRRSGGISDGISNRSHRLKGLGNAIVPQVAAQILGWMRGCMDDTYNSTRHKIA